MNLIQLMIVVISFFICSCDMLKDEDKGQAIDETEDLTDYLEPDQKESGETDLDASATDQVRPCWDTNSNGERDEDEDLNEDDRIDARDCRGIQGDSGKVGAPGLDGTPGIAGERGEKGDPGEKGSAGDGLLVKEAKLELLDFEGSFSEIVDPRTHETLLGIKKSSLDQELLYNPSFFDYFLGHTEPLYFGTKIVWFSQVGARVYLHESMEAKTVDDFLPLGRILTQFEILFESDSAIAIDFNDGISQFYADFSMDSATEFECFLDGYCQEYNNELTPIIDILDGYIDGIESSDDRVFISQIFNFHYTGYPAPKSTMIAYHQFVKYSPNQNFLPKYTNYQKQIGFFETHPLVESGKYPKSEYFIEKWDIAKPIKFSISANTPYEFIEPITDGVLYWNKVFGQDVLEVELLDDPSIKPTSPDYNVIQWIDWDNDYAYAMFQANPLTGEILHGMVYLPNWKAMLFDLEAIKTATAELEEEPVLTAFSSDFACKFPLKYLVKHNKILDKNTIIPLNFPKYLSTNAPDNELVDRMIYDTYRTLVAHEVGHVLGLRHNFAGNVGSNIPEAEYENAYLNYYQLGEVSKERIPSSTVMDYPLMPIDSWIGALIKENALPYDLAAIKWGYFDEDIASIAPPPFCPDGISYFGIYSDCMPFDVMANPILSGKFEQDYFYSKYLLTALVNLFIRAKAPYYADERIKSIDEVLLYDFEAFLLNLAVMSWPFVDTAFPLFPGNRFIRIEHSYPQEVNNPMLSITAQAEIIEENQQYALNSIYSGGGFAELFYHFIANTSEDSPYPDVIQEVHDQFVAIVKSDWFKEGTTIYGVPYSFTTEEIDLVLEKAGSFFEVFSEYNLSMMYYLLEMINLDFVDHWYSLDPLMAVDDLASIQETLLNSAERIIASRKDNSIVTPILDSEFEISFREGFYSRDLKMAAVKSLQLSSDYLIDPEWAQEFKTSLGDYLTAKFEVTKSNVLDILSLLYEEGVFPYEIDTSEDTNPPGVVDYSVLKLLPAELRKWFEDEMAVISQLAHEDFTEEPFDQSSDATSDAPVEEPF